MKMNISCTIVQDRKEENAVVYQCKSLNYDQCYGFIEATNTGLQRARYDTEQNVLEYWDIPDNWNIEWHD